MRCNDRSLCGRVRPTSRTAVCCSPLGVPKAQTGWPGARREAGREANMARGKITPWPGVKGGYVRKGVYYFRRSVPGMGQREFSTYRTTQSAALAELERFERDPLSYESAPA